MDGDRPRSVFGTSWGELEQENRRRRAEVQVRALTGEVYQAEVREILEHELRKTPEQCAEERKEWFEKGVEKARRARKQFLKPRRPKWSDS